MAQTETNKKLTKQVQGLGYLTSGATVNEEALADYNDSDIQAFLQHYRQLVNNNIKVDAPEADDEEPVSFAEKMPGTPKGAKDALKTLADRAIAKERLDYDQQGAIEAAMSVAGYKVELDNELSEEELGVLPRFRNNLDSLTLEQIANSNFIEATEAARRAEVKATLDAQQKAAQEKLAIDQELLKDKVAATLVSAGYLAPENAENDKRIASAMKRMMAEETRAEDLVSEEKKIFQDFNDWKVTPYALEYALKTTSGMMPQNADRTKSLLQEQLESNDPAQIKLAQATLAITNPNVKITGEIDTATYKAGLEEMRKPLTMPADLLKADGSVRLDSLAEMAVHGQLYLPLDKLSEEDQKRAMAMPLAADREPGALDAREKFIAFKLIAKDPQAYQAILDEENARRANATLDNDLLKISQENVSAIAVVAETKLEAAALPPNFAELAVRYAADNGGAIRVEHIPYVLGQAKGNATTLMGGIDYARLHGPAGGIDDLSKSIKLDPNSPDFTANLNEVLKTAYVMENARSAGITVNNIPAEVAEGFKQVADAQLKISTSGVDNKIETFGLPTDFLAKLHDVDTDGNVMALQVAQVLHTLDPNGAGSRTNPSNYMGDVYRTDLESLYGKGNSAIDKIVESDYVINVNDPQQLAVALQVAIAMKDGVSLDEVQKRQGIVNSTVAVAHGYLGTNPPEPLPEATPEEKQPEGTPVSANEDTLKGKFAFAHDGVKADTAAPQKVATADNNNRQLDNAFNIG